MVWKIASLYVATVIGAGFASGQEIVQFFARFGSSGFIGIAIAGFLLSYCGSLTLRKCVALKFADYNQLITSINKTAAPFLDLLYTTFIMLEMAVMFAGTEEALLQLLGISGGMYITAALTLLPLLVGLDKVLDLNGYLVPVMIVFMSLVSVLTIVKGKPTGVPGLVAAVPYGALYGGYNYGFALAVFAGIGQLVKDEQQAEQGGWLGGLILTVLITLAAAALLTAPPEIMNTSLPLLTLANRISPAVGTVYTLVIWIAMYTTALANAFAVTQRLHPWLSGQWWKVCVLVLAAALLIARIGFVPLIKYTYSAFGLIGLYLLYKMLRL